MKKKSHDSKKTTNGTGHNKPVKGIIVLFTLESLKEICHETRCQRMCYGDATLADTVAMEKILTAMAEGKDSVVI
jgi:hypothetical protein